MIQSSTNVVSCQAPGLIYQARCTFCWTLRTSLGKDGRFISHRVFCHHPGCEEWQRVHARLETAPVMQWDDRHFAEITNGPDWEKFKRYACDVEWLGVPTARGTLMVFVQSLVTKPLEALGFKRAEHTSIEIENLIRQIPEGRKIRKSRVDTVERRQIGVQIAHGLPVRPNLEYVLPGVDVAALEQACDEAGVESYRAGPYADYVESVGPLTMVQAMSLATLLDDLRRR